MLQLSGPVVTHRRLGVTHCAHPAPQSAGVRFPNESPNGLPSNLPSPLGRTGELVRRMGLQKGGEGVPEGARPAVRPISVKLVVEVLRGVAQVNFMPSAVCGLLFVVALFAAGRQYGLYGLLGSAVSTAAGYGLRLRRDSVEAGLAGYNGCLVALACAVFLGPGHPATVVVAVLGAVVAPFGGHASTWPFVLTALLFLAAVPAIPRLRRI
ncbi:urea transporter [Kitasatospora sp. NPDC098652]|uniref:urea transporter n=1 Tax=Kitasatospora sp. NPDC098652 TaxID=3364095 RepID=UPI00382EAF45